MTSLGNDNYVFDLHKAVKLSIGTDFGALRDLCKNRGLEYVVIRKNGVPQEVEDDGFNDKRLRVVIDKSIVKEIYIG